MQQFIEKYRDQITGVLSGLDRLVFRAAPRRLNFGYFDKNLKAFVARGMEEYYWQNRLLYKEYQKHPEVCWILARIHCWYAFNIPLGLNGREWLARQMDQAGLQYVQALNCFTWIEYF